MARKDLRQKLIGIAAGAFVLQGLLQVGAIHDRWAKDYLPKGNVATSVGLDPQQYLFALAGFREMIAGILWVRADSFFDTGNYDAILPLIRLITILDPRQIDVYATGMWHIGYNFTDEDQRSDRRYIPSALALGKEGAKNNDNTYEMFFETGWMWYNKIDDDYFQAVKWFEEAGKRDDIQPARRNLLAMAYLRNGQLKDALNFYYNLSDRATELYKRDDAYMNRQNRETIQQNLDNLIVRMSLRGEFAQMRGDYDQMQYDTKPPFDVNFSVKATVVEPRVIQFEGSYGVLPVGTRIRVTLKDSDYDPEVASGLNWDFSDKVELDPPKDRTFMQDQLFVKNRRFNKKVDMSKDPTMYPFVKDKYLIEFYYNPRSAPPHIQDKFGYLGEGFTDGHFLSTDVRKDLDGKKQRVLYTKFEVTKDQILRRGEWQDKIPVFKTVTYKDIAPGENKDDVIFVPTLRSGK